MKSKVIKLKAGKVDHLQGRIQRAKWSYATRRVSIENKDLYVRSRMRPQAGDLVLAKVKRLGQHKRIELANGRRARMFVGDDIVVVYGNRYAPDQFEAIVPADLEPCHLVAAGGIAAQMTYRHEAMKQPTAIEPVGILTRTDGTVVNLRDHAIKKRSSSKPFPPVLAVVGGSMNTGKTTTAASLVRGLTLAGYNVYAGKVTGTGSGCDNWHILDAGARMVKDFIDSGHPSTYLLSPHQIEDIFETVISHLNRRDSDFIVLEVADGLFQSETARLIKSDLFHRLVDGVLYAASDALSAVHGVEMLLKWKVPVFGISGVVTRSPLGMREVLDELDLPVFGRRVLCDPAIENHVDAWLEHGVHTKKVRGNG